MPAGLMASVTPTLIPATPDLARMRRERMGRVHAAMREQGLDALVLLGNTNVVYATGAIWPLADSGRANFEQPVALVLAEDEWPHLFSPMREDDRLLTELPADHLHGPVYLDFDEGVQLFAAQLAELLPVHATVAMDEWTNALRRERSILFAHEPPVDGGRVISKAKATKTPDELSCMRDRHCGSRNGPSPRCKPASRLVCVRPTSPRPSCARSSMPVPMPTFSIRFGR